MEFVEGLFLWVGVNFTTDVYMFYTKFQGMLWSLADIILVLAFLRIADLIRLRRHESKMRFRYLLLWFSALITPLLLLTQTPRQILILESIICGTQFSILVYTVISERKGMLDVMRELRADYGP
jgi:hypothetical protein